MGAIRAPGWPARQAAVWRMRPSNTRSATHAPTAIAATQITASSAPASRSGSRRWRPTRRKGSSGSTITRPLRPQRRPRR